MKKRILSFVLTILMVASVLPLGLFSSLAIKYTEGGDEINETIVNYSTLAGANGSNGMIKDLYRQGMNNCSWSYENGVFEYLRPSNYTLQAKTNVSAEGKNNLVEIKSISQGSSWNGPSFHFAYDTGVKLKDAKYLTMDYFYKRNSGQTTGGSIGKHAYLQIRINNKNFFVLSDNTIKAGVWETLRFNLSGLTADANYESVKEENIAEIFVYYYDNDLDIGSDKIFSKSYGLPANDIFYISDFDYMDGIPAITYTAKFMVDDTLFKTVETPKTVVMPDYTVTDPDYYLQGWTDGTTNYSVGQSVDITDNKTFTAIIRHVNTEENFETIPHEAITRNINTSGIDGNVVRVTFEFAQDGTTSGSATDGALLSINGQRTIRITGGNGLHVFQTDDPWYVAGSNTWDYAGANYPANPVSATLVFLLDSGKVNISYKNKTCTLSGFDFSENIALKFGGADTPRIQISNYKTEILNARIVTLTSDDNVVSENLVLEGENFVFPYDTQKTGYHLVGWTDGTSIFNRKESIAIYKDRTYSAVWEEGQSYKVTFKCGSNYKNEDYLPSPVVMPNPSSFNGSIFDGWNDGTGSRYKVGETVEITKDTVFTAVYTKTLFDVPFIYYNGSDFITVATKSTTSSSDKITTPSAPAKDGYTFKGWTKDFKSFVNAETEISVNTDNKPYYAVYEKSGHSHTYNNLVVPANCYDAEITYRICECGNINTYLAADNATVLVGSVTGPVLGHSYGAYVVNGEYQTRTCSVCGHSEIKKIIEIPNTVNLYAIGDSITFGQKVSGYRENSYAKYLADALGLNYVNEAASGSRLSAWRSVLTQSNNHNQYADNHAGGVTREMMLENIAKAGIVVFTLSANDLFATNTGANIETRMYEFVDEIHRINPDAVIIVVNGGYMVSFWDNSIERLGVKNCYSQYQWNMAELNKRYTEGFAQSKYDFVYYVDVSKEYSTLASFTTEITGDPDGVHPGQMAYRNFRDDIISALGNTTVVEPTVTYTVEFYNSDNSKVGEDNAFGVFTLPMAPTPLVTDAVFKGWTNDGGVTIYKAGSEVNVKENMSFTAVWRIPEEPSKITYSLSGLVDLDKILDAFSDGYTEENGVYTYTHSNRYKYSVQNDVIFNGTNTIKFTSLINTNAAGNTSGQCIVLPIFPTLDIEDMQYITLTYYYGAVGNQTNAGVNWQLKFIVNNETFTVNSENVAIAGEWATIKFNLANMSGNFEDYLGMPVTDLKLLFFEGSHIRDMAGAEYYFATITLENRANEVTPYTINYVGKDSEDLGSDTANYGIITVRDELPEISGYRFKGYKNGETIVVPGTKLVISDNTTLDAYYKLIETYNVSFMNGDTTVYATTTEDTVIAPSAQQKDGFNFVGWSDGNTVYGAGEEIEITANTVFNAVFEEKVYYTVTITNLNNQISSAEYESGTVITLPMNLLSDDNQKFTGWSDGNKVYAEGADYTVNGNVTISGQWVPVVWRTVTYKDGQGNVVKTYKIEDGAKFTVQVHSVTKGKYTSSYTDGSSSYSIGKELTANKDYVLTPVETAPLENHVNDSGYVTLANTLYKLENGQKLTVGVIGDSIGYGQIPGGISSLEGVNYNSKFSGKNPMAYPRVFSDWFDYYVENELEITGADIDYYYSVWGGATLYTTMGYISEDILGYNPDLYIIEVWNSITRNGVNTAWLESMLQVIYAKNPYADIILLDVGGEFNLGEHKSVADKYGVPFIRVINQTQNWFNNVVTFGTGLIFHSGVYAPDENGSILGTRGYYFNNGSPHVNEECYLYWNYMMGKSVKELVALAKQGATYGTYSYAQPASRRITLDGQTVVYPTDTLADISKLIFYSTDITADEMNASGTWTLTGSVDRTAPLDSADRASACKLTPSAVGNSVTVTFKGCGFLVRGNGSFTYSIDGGASQTLSIGSYIELGANDAQHTLVISCTNINNAYLQEVYLYSHEYKAVENHENVKDRNVVAYYAKLNDEYIHDDLRNGNPILPAYLTYYNVKRVDTFGDELHTILGSNIIFPTCETKGAFVGWMEADEIEFVDGEKIPTVYPFTYVKDGSGNIIGAIYVDGGAEKKIYLEGEEINPTGNTLNLVAVYKNSADDAIVFNVTFKDGEETVSTAYTYGQLTVPSALNKDGYTFMGWSNGTSTYKPGVVLDISESTNANIEFTAVWRNNSEEPSRKYNFSDIIPTSFEALTSYSRYSYNYALDKYIATVTDQNGVRYQHILSRNEIFDGKNVAKIYGDSMPGAGSGTPTLKLGNTGIKLKNSKYILVEYYLDSPTNNTCAGQTMRINFYVNGVKYTVSATSSIAKGAWKTVQFNVYEVVDVATLGEYEITDITLEFTGNIAGQFNAKIPAGGSMNLSTIEFTNGHTAQFKDGSGNLIANGDISAIDGIIVLPNIASLTDAQNKLVGWSDGENDYEVGETVTVTAENQIFTPIFDTIIYYNVTFKSFEEILDISGSYPEVFNLPSALIKDGYRFDGWLVGEDVLSAGASVTISGETEITAVWTEIYHVTVKDGETVLLDGDYAGEVTLPGVQNSDGYVFVGYTDGTNTYNAGETLILTGNITLNALKKATTPGAVLNLADEVCVGNAFLRNGGGFLVSGNGYRIIKNVFEGQSVMTISSYTDHDGSQLGSGFRIGTVNAKVTDTPYITLTYKLERANPNVASNTEGKQMMLIFKVKKNASNDVFADRNTFYVFGDETISADGWRTVVFDLHNLHDAYLAVNGDLYDYTQLSDRYFDYLELQWCSTLNRHDYSKFYAKNGENLHISTMCFTTVNPNFTVSFDENGGETIADVTSKGSAVLPEISYAGHKFLGWSCDGGNTLLPAGTQVAVTGDVTYKAFWRELEVKFYDYETLYTTLNGTDSVIAPDCTIEKEGETFVGWSDGTTVYEVGETISITDDTVLTAVWKGAFKATFMDGETEIGVVPDIKTLTIPDYEMVKAGKEFVAWILNGEQYHAGDVITLTEDVVFDAEWRIETIDAIFKDGNKVIETVSVNTEEDDIVVIPSIFKNGFVFKGFTSGGTVYMSGDRIRLTGDTEFEALFVEESAIHDTTFDLTKLFFSPENMDFGVSISGTSYNQDTGVWSFASNRGFEKYELSLSNEIDNVTALKIVAKNKNTSANEKYYFEKTGLNIPVANAKRITVNVYFEGAGDIDGHRIKLAFYTDNANSNYKKFLVHSNETVKNDEWNTLTFDIENAVEEDSSKGSAFDYTKVENNNITGFRFYWFENVESRTDGNKANLNAGDKFYFTNLTISNYHLVGNKVTVMNGEEVLASAYTKDKAKLPVAPESDELVFKGFRVGDTLAEAGDEISVTTDTIVSAEWVGSHSARFVDEQTEYGYFTEINDITIPHFEVPEKVGFFFLGWSNDGGTTVYTEGQNVALTGDEVFEAVWGKTYRVIVKKDDLTIFDEYCVDSVKLPQASVKDYYTFIGWSDGTNVYDAEEVIPVNADITLVSVWEAEKFTATFIDGDRTIATFTDKTIEDKITIPDAYTKDGYIFVGFISGTSTYVSGERIILTGNTTFEAVFVTDSQLAESDFDFVSCFGTEDIPIFSGFDTKTYDDVNGKWTIVRRAATYEIALAETDGKNTLKLVTKAINNGYTETYCIAQNGLNIPVSDINRITIKVYFEGANGEDGQKMQLLLKTDNGNSNYQNLVIISNEALKNGQWNTVTFDIKNAVNKQSSINKFDLTKIAGNNITGFEFRWYDWGTRTDMGGISLRKNDTFYLTDLKFSNYSPADYTATFENDGTVLSKAKTNDKVVLPSALEVEGFDFDGWSDGTTVYEAGETVAITADTTFTAVLTAQHVHTVVEDKGYPATCFEAGLTDGSHCSECLEVIVAQEVIPQLQHSFIDDVCEHCGMVIKQNLPDPSNPGESIDVTVLPEEEHEAVETDKGEYSEELGETDVSVKLEGIKDAIKKSFMDILIESASALASENNENILINIKAQSEILNVIKEENEIKKIKYEVKPIAELIKNSKTVEQIMIDNENLDGGKIKVTLSTAGSVPLQVIHTKENGIKEYFYPESTGKDNTFVYDEANETVTIEISEFSEIELLVIEENEANFVGTQVTLGEAIAVKMFVDLKGYTDEEIARMTVDFLIGFEASTLNKNGVTISEQEEGNYVFRFDGITPQCINDEITATLKLDGEVIAVFRGYTILSYLENVYENELTDTATKELISALYTYGITAKTYTGYDSANAIYSAVIPELSLAENVVDTDPLIGKTKFGETSNPDGIRIDAGNVKYGSYTYLMFRLAGEGIDESLVSVKIDGETQDITIDGGIISMPGLYASDITEIMEIKLFYDGVEIQTVNYGVGAYVYSMERKQQDEIFLNLIRAVYIYGIKADAIQ